MHSCGQNVYSLSTNRWITCVFASTASEDTLLPFPLCANNSQVFHTAIDRFFTQLSTLFFSISTPVKTRFSTLSTLPITTSTT